MHVYISTADVDSCCAFRILKSMMFSDGIPFSAYPVSGYQARAYTSFTSQHNLSAFYGIGGARRGCAARVEGVLGGVL